MAITNPTTLQASFDANKTNVSAPSASQISNGYVTNEIPLSANHGFMFNEWYQWINYYKINGTAQYDATVSYNQHSRIMRNGAIYRSLSDANSGNDPEISPAFWEEVITNAITGSKNRLINPNGIINQRGYVSGTVTTGANEYTLDRWRVITLGEALTFSTTNNKTTFTAPLNGVEQIIEGNNLQSGTFVVSGLLTATCTVDGVAKTNGETFTVVGGTDVSVKFFNGTFELPQIEAGDRVTSFEQRSEDSEFSSCQRYYQTAASLFLYIVTTDSTVRRGYYARTVTMRIDPVETGSISNTASPVLSGDVGAIQLACVATVAGTTCLISNYTADAEL